MLENITRRQFLEFFGRLIAVAVLPISIGGCSSTSKPPFYEEYPFKETIRNPLQTTDSRIKGACEAYAQIDEIKGAIYDREINWPIIFGTIKNIEEDSQKRPDEDSLMNLDELIMCIKVVQQGYDPGVSIEPPGSLQMGSIPSNQIVRYIPESIKGTQLGKKVFEADRALKGLGFGSDPITGRRVRSRVNNYKTLAELARQDRNLRVGYFGRIWFKPKEVLLKKGEDIILFEKVTIKVESESQYSAPVNFASNLEKNYEKLSKEFPIYRDLLRIGKEVAIGRWLVDENHGLGLEDYKMQSVYSPSKTDTISGVVRETYYANYIKQEVLIGGVIYNVRNHYDYSPSSEDIKLILNTETDQGLPDIKNLVLGARAKETDTNWRCQIGGKEYMVIALPFERKELHFRTLTPSLLPNDTPPWLPNNPPLQSDYLREMYKKMYDKEVKQLRDLFKELNPPSKN